MRVVDCCFLKTHYLSVDVHALFISNQFVVVVVVVDVVGGGGGFIVCGGGQPTHMQLGGYTALIFAVGNGHAECARLLLDAGADASATEDVVRENGVLAVSGVCANFNCKFYCYF